MLPDDRPEGTPHGVSVVNCAVVYALVPDAQLALTLQSYCVVDDKPLNGTEVDAVAVAAFIQVDDAVVL